MLRGSFVMKNAATRKMHWKEHFLGIIIILFEQELQQLTTFFSFLACNVTALTYDQTSALSRMG
jgi:hypothetical protein